MVYLAAERLKVAPLTVYRYAQRHPQIKQAIEDERGKLLDFGESALYSAVVRGEGWAVCFLLKTLGKHRGYVERQEIDIEDSRPIRLIPARCGDSITAFTQGSIADSDESGEDQSGSSGKALGQNGAGRCDGDQ